MVRTEKKSQNAYLTSYNLLLAQDLWQADYQILSIISLKKFLRLNVNTDMIIKNGKLEELNSKSVRACYLEYTNAKDDLTENCYVAKRIIKKCLMKT